MAAGDGSAPLTRRDLLRYGGAFGAAVALGSGPTARIAEASGLRRKPHRGGELRVAQIGGAGATQNPYLTFTQADRNRDYLIYEPLGNTTYDGTSVMGVLAESATPNANATVWTVKLRKGVKFHDGSPLTAQDVVYTYRTVTSDPTLAASIGLPALMLSAQVTAADSHTVRFHFASPSPEAPEVALYIGYPLIIRNGDSNYANESIGTGPFMLSSLTLGESVLLKRNPHYWGRAPYLDAVEISSVVSDAARISGVRGKSFDYAGSIPIAYAAQNKGSRVVSLHPSNATGSLIFGFWMNARLAPFNDPRVRMAFKLACNRKQLVDNVTGGLGRIANDSYAIGYAGSAKLPQRAFDPKQAKSLLAQAGASGLKVTIVSLSNRPGSTEAATVYAQQLSAIGVNASVEPVASGQFYPKLSDWTKTYQVFSGPFPNLIWPNEASTYLVPGGSRDLGGWTSASWAASFQKARTMVDSKKRRAIDNALQRQVWADGPVILWATVPNVNASLPTVEGVRDRGVPYMLYPNFTATYLQA